MGSFTFVDLEHEKTTFIGPTIPSDWRVKVGSLWSDTTTNLLKRATSISPITFVSVEGGGGGGGGVATIRESDNAPSINPATVLEFDQVDGFVVTEPSAGVAKVNLPSIPQASVVNLVTDLAAINTDIGLVEGDITTLQTDVTAVEGDITALQTDKVPTTRTISTTAPLAGGGDLSANRTLTVADGSTTVKGVVELATDGESAASVVVQGNDARLSNARTPTAHKTSHENGGGDELSVAGLSGLLADGQTPIAHASSHNDGGADEISLTGLAGLSVTPQTPATHATSHNNGGADEISVAGLSGLLADGQTPLAHVLDSASHTISGKADNQVLRATGATSFAFEAVPFSKGGVVIDPTARNIIIWRATEACTVTNVRGYRVGGSGAAINARRNGTSNHLASDLSLTGADSWTDGGSVQNTAYAAGDKLEIMIVSVAGAPTQVAVHVDFTIP